MFSLHITNPEAHPYTVNLIETTCSVITPHWKEFFPALQVVLTCKPLPEIPELQEFWKAQTLSRNDCYAAQIICPEFDASEATFWVRFHDVSVMFPREYYFKKEFYQVIAQLLWATSNDIRELMNKRTIKLVGKPETQYAVFRDTFSRYFLNPDWLQERKPEAWKLFSGIDQDLLCPS